ncbi:NADH-quinone oxidoreductase subunit NuoB [Phosphitispora sp. TUW77]|uniref:NADH-quinone oxidoreductase subunit NuoB n=1 Tax=Phosphitispora sp. TUW77 TaxID=3152361 RepID=UPI003AB338A5
MLRIFKKSFQTGVITTGYPKEKEVLPPGFRGMPEWQEEKCPKCGKCAAECPTGAIKLNNSGDYWSIDPKKCIFCGYCQDTCENSAVFLGSNYELAETACREKVSKIFGRSAHIRHLDAGSCNACDWEMVALTGPVYDIQRFGFSFVASPRHADILMVTGPVTRNLEIAARKTFNATPAPKLVVAVGACACSGGICGKSYASSGGVDNILPVDVYIPGCPPKPQALIHGLMTALDRLK